MSHFTAIHNKRQGSMARHMRLDLPYERQVIEECVR